MSIEEIYFYNEISPVAFYSCIDNKIETIPELIEIYSTHGSFKNILNCGEKINNELISICLKYYNFKQTNEFKDLNSNEVSIQMMITSLNQNQQNLINYFINEIYTKLPTRTKNGLGRYLEGEISLKKINLKIFSNQFFKPGLLVNLGNKSIPELHTFLNGVKEYIFKVYELKDENEIYIETSKSFENKLVIDIKNLNYFRRQIINNHIKIQFSKLPKRSQNALNYYLEKQINITNISDRIFSDINFNFKRIKNIGTRSYSELELFFNDIKFFVIKIIDNDDEKNINGLSLKLFLKETFNDLEIDQNIISKNSIFSIIQFLLEEQVLLGKNENYILKNGVLIYENIIPQKLEQLAENLNLTKERCRQIRIRILEELENKFIFLKQYDQDLLANYNLDFNASSIYITDEIAANINTLDETNFSKHFITLIISFYYKNKYDLIGNLSDVIIAKDLRIKARYTWSNLFLVRQKLSQNFDFVKFIEDVDKRKLETIDETYKLNFKSHLSKFFKKDDLFFLDEIFPICELLMNEELGICLDNEQNIVFERNTYKTLPEYAYEALEIIGKPSHIDEINKQIKILKPEYNNAILNSTMSRAFGFVPYGRASIFGLKKWDTEKRNIKGGTIRSIAEEFLQNYSEPIKYKVVANYVLKYRPESNIKSIIYNLKMEDNNRFVFFKNSLIGLKSKNYQIDLFSAFERNVTTTLRSWEENYQELLNFMLTNNKFPSATSASTEEKRICAWFYVQTNKINNNLLDESKTNLILEIKNNVNSREQKSIQFKSNGYNKLYEFIEINKRLPSARKKDERTLYYFFYKQRKQFEEGNLDSEEKLKFIQIEKLLQQSKSEIP